jgi:D-alanyl-D-alanine carboxypeptidase/D-alanyl-D-alanine-endopeptidase (penicillin-binding protein 4)
MLVAALAISGLGGGEANGAPPANTGSQSPGWSREAKTAVDKLSRRLEDDGGRIGAAIIALPSGELVASANETAAMNPASNAKLATAVAALELLGAEHRFVTGLYGELDEGKVARLVLRGAGDPTLGTADLAELVRELKDAGATEVGEVLVDQGYFDERYDPPAYDQQPNEWAAFRAPIAAVSLDRNTVSFTVYPGASKDSPARVSVSPPGFTSVEGSVTTGKKGSAERIGLSLAGKAGRLEAKLSGSIAEGSRPATYVRRVDDPRKLAGYALLAVLREQGVRAPNEVALGGEREKRTLALHESAPLGQIIQALGKDSDNFTAEMLFRAVGAAEKDPTPEAAVKAVEKVLRDRGALGAGERVVNGSGLFDANRSSALSLAKLLSSASADPRLGPELVAHLAIGGVDGTLRGRLRALKEKRYVRAKTGTLAKTVALSGYVLGPDGAPRAAFSFIAETPAGKTKPARDAIDGAVVALARAIEQNQN